MADSDDTLVALEQALSELFGAERRLRRRLKGDLGITHVRALIWLSRNGGAGTAGDVARETDLNPASVTGMLDQLEAQGLVTRARSQTDRRVVEVSLTPAGQEMVKHKRARWRRRWQEALEEVSPADRLAAATVLRRLAALYDGLERE